MPVTEYRPPAELAPFVDAFWSRSAGGRPNADESRRILPDGCLDIVVGPQHAIVVGTMTRPLVLPAGDGGRMVGVRFRPGMATAFLGVPAAALTDDSAPLEAVWSDGAELAEYVGSSAGAELAVARLAERLVGRLPRIAAIPPDLLAAVERIVAAGGRTDISRLAASLGLTRQHLARRFAAHVGVPPKTLCRVVRLWTVLRAARGERVNWAALAANLGFSDQSHLVAEFRALTGLTPSRWIADQGAGSKSPRRRRQRAVV